jgi:methyl-accepting chemotaxis protein
MLFSTKVLSMNRIINAFTVKKRFAALLALFALGFLTYGAWSFKTLQQLQINSPLYQRIVQGKDLVADILPPPEYIIESYLVSFELVKADEKKDQDKLIEKLKTLKGEYDTRHEYWLKQELTGEMADLFLNNSYKSAINFYDIALNELVPAVQRGDKNTINTGMDRLAQAYKVHRWAIDQIVPMINQRTASDETIAAQRTETDGALLLVILIGSLLGSTVFGFLIAHSIVVQLGGEPRDVVDIAKQIAQGNLSNQIKLQSGDKNSLLATVKLMQQELQRIVSQLQRQVECAVRGDFTHNVDLAGKQGFELEICQTLNHLNQGLLQKIGGNPDDAVFVANQIAAGELNVTLTTRQGDSESILAAMAAMRTNLQSIIADVQQAVDAAANGDFSYRMDEASRRGYAKTLAELLNRLNRTSEQSLSDIARLASALAKGDLTQRIDKNYPGLFGATASGINATRDNLLTMINEIVDSVAAIHSSASQIASGNLDLSQRTEQQAASLEENASSMEQLASTVKQNADNSRLANRLVSETADVAVKGGSAVGDVVKTMDSIYESSYKVADIISVIDGLAFQTNILALNAAVEAARAGEQGRGFAVVASEVRSLAQRSAAAAKEIKDLIANSVAKVESGSAQVEQAGKTMNEVVTSVQRVTDLMSEISAATSEQSVGINEVNQAILQMDSVTQQNASLVEEAAAAAQSLEDQARHLQGLISVFRLQA